jgi:vancomycin permeability regulator SanA
MNKNSASFNRKWKLISVIIGVIVLNLLFLYYIKYKNQGISLTDFNLTYVGNLLNLFFTLLLIIGILLYSFGGRNVFKPGLLIFYTVLMTFCLFFAEFYYWLKIPIPNYYFFEHPLKEIIKGIFFALFQLIQFIFISIVWITFLGKKELLILKSLINSVIITLFLLLIAFLYLGHDVVRNIDIIYGKNTKFVGVVMGAAVWSDNRPSPSLAARAEMAAELYKKGVLKFIQVTGGHAPGELSEAEVAYIYLKHKGVDSSNIWIEKYTSSTSEQVRFIKNELVDKDNLKNIIIISDSYHLARIKEICSFYKIKTYFAASEMHLSFYKKIAYKFRESIALLVFWFFAL